MQMPNQTADREYYASSLITNNLYTDIIIDQEMDITKLDKKMNKEVKQKMRKEKELQMKTAVQQILGMLPEKQKRAFQTAQEKGASAWLSALPIQALGYALNKQEFRDAVCLRYGWNIENMPTFCACGEPTSIDHTGV